MLENIELYTAFLVVTVAYVDVSVRCEGDGGDGAGAEPEAEGEVELVRGGHQQGRLLRGHQGPRDPHHDAQAEHQPPAQRVTSPVLVMSPGADLNMRKTASRSTLLQPSSGVSSISSDLPASATAETV